MSFVKAARLPETEAGARALLARLPATIDDRKRVATSSPREVSYGPGVVVTVAPLREAAGPDMAMTSYFARLVTAGGYVVDSHAATGSELLWFSGATRDAGAAGTPTRVAAVASAKGTWLYGFEAPDAATMDRLLTAFAAALT